MCLARVKYGFSLSQGKPLNFVVFYNISINLRINLAGILCLNILPLITAIARTLRGGGGGGGVFIHMFMFCPTSFF